MYQYVIVVNTEVPPDKIRDVVSRATDCIRMEVYEEPVDATTVDLVITDPPDLTDHVGQQMNQLRTELWQAVVGADGSPPMLFVGSDGKLYETCFEVQVLAVESDVILDNLTEADSFPLARLDGTPVSVIARGQQWAVVIHQGTVQTVGNDRLQSI